MQTNGLIAIATFRSQGNRVNTNILDMDIPRACRAATLAGVVSAALSSGAWADFDRGRALYENHCRQCHDSWAHDADGRTVATYDGLRQRVASWSHHSGLGWSTAEIGAVTEYLNRRFYQLVD
jgi:mono/diheme cytochrome c family protein